MARKCRLVCCQNDNTARFYVYKGSHLLKEPLGSVGLGGWVIFCLPHRSPSDHLLVIDLPVPAAEDVELALDEMLNALEWTRFATFPLHVDCPATVVG